MEELYQALSDTTAEEQCVEIGSSVLKVRRDKVKDNSFKYQLELNSSLVARLKRSLFSKSSPMNTRSVIDNKLISEMLTYLAKIQEQ